MNANCYKTIFSKRLGCLVAVGEHAVGQGKAPGTGGLGLFGSYFLAPLCLSFAAVSLAWGQTAVPATTALPTGGSVSAGAASISSSGAAMTIQQATDRAAINWQSFNIGQNASVNVVQPGAQSVLLNRVVGESPTQILGRLSANGQIVLVNPNGIAFGKDGSVSAGGFVASTLGISDRDFMAGQMRFEANGSTAGVVNQGTIQTRGGYVALLGASVSNEGRIQTGGGAALLGAAEAVQIPLGSTGRIKLELSPAQLNASVANTADGVIVTEGGQVYMQAAAVNQALARVFQDGQIDSSAAQGGAVHVLADGGQIRAGGRITANSSGSDGQGQPLAGGDIVIGRDLETGVLAAVGDASGAVLESRGGFVETSGKTLKTDGIRVKAREWLLDPYNITIANSASGTPYADNYTAGATSVIRASDIATSLNNGTSVTISTGMAGSAGADAGDIAVNASINTSGSTNTSLTLQAARNITFASNSQIVRTGTGKLDVTLNSNFGSANNGHIDMKSGSGITSNGGNITLGGGSAGNGSGFAVGSFANSVSSQARGTGVQLFGATLDSGAGNITLRGQGDANDSNWYMYGVLIDSSDRGSGGTGSRLITSGGNIQIHGTGGGSGGSIANVGIQVDHNSQVQAGGAGNLTMTGIGGTSATGRYNHGFYIAGQASLSSVDGNIGLTGTAATSGATQGDNFGLQLVEGSSIRSTGSGSVNMTLTGGQGGDRNHGLLVGDSGSNTISANSGNVSITATAGVGASSLGINSTTANTISSSSGNLTLTSDSMNWSSNTSLSAAAGTITVQNRTANTLVNVGGSAADVAGADGTRQLSITQAEYGRLTANNLVIGTTTSGNTTVSSALAMGGIGSSLTLNSGGNLTVNGTITGDAAPAPATDTVNLRARGNVTIASAIDTQGGDLFVQSNVNNGSAGLVQVNAALSGRNISLENTGGSIDTSTGAITKGSRRSNIGSGVTIGSTVTATGNLNVFGSSNASSGIQGVDISSRLQAANFSIEGEADPAGWAHSGVAAVRLRNGSQLVGTATTGSNLIQGTYSTPQYGSSSAVLLGDLGTAVVDITSAAPLSITGTSTYVALRNSSQIGHGITTQGRLTTSGAITMTGTARSGDGVALNGTINHSGGNLSINGTTNPVRVETGNSANGVLVNATLTVTDGSNLDMTGTYQGWAGQTNTTTNNTPNATGITVTSVLGGTGGTLNLTGMASSTTSSASERGMYLQAANGWGNTTLLAQNPTGSSAPALFVNGTLNVGSNPLQVLANGGRIEQNLNSTWTAGRITVDNTGAGRSSLFADTSGGANIALGQSFGGGIAADGSITVGNAAITNGSTTNGINLNQGTLNSTGDVNIATNSRAMLSSFINSSNGKVKAQALGALTLSRALSARTGVELLSRGDMALSGNGNITNSTSGDVVLAAGDGTTGSTAVLFAATGTTITQGANANVVMSTDGQGDLTPAKVTKTGTGSGDIVIAAGKQLPAGTASGGQVTTISGNNITNSGTGTAYVYTGMTNGYTGLRGPNNLTFLASSLNNLDLAAGVTTGSQQNAQTNVGYNASSLGIAGSTARVQALFRGTVAMPSVTLNGATVTKTYGDSSTAQANASSLWDDVKTALKAANTGNVTTAGTTGSNFRVSRAGLIDSLTATSLASPSYSSTNYLNASTTGYSLEPLGSSSSQVSWNSTGTVRVVVNRARLSTISGGKTYDGQTATLIARTSGGNLTLTGVNNETASLATGSSVALSGANAGTRSVTSAGISSLSNAVLASGGTIDLGNYDLSQAPTTNTVTIDRANLVLSGTRAYDGSTRAAGSTLTATGVANESFAITGAGDDSNLSSKNARSNGGATALSTVAGLSLGTGSGGALADNYNALTATGSSYTVTKADLVLSGSRTYDGSTRAAGSTLTATGVAGETFTVTGAGDDSNLSSKNARSNGGATALSTVTGLSLDSSDNGGDAGNYNALTATGSSYTVNQAVLTQIAGSKTYDGQTATLVAGTSSGNLTLTGVNGETATLATGSSVALSGANAGTRSVTSAGISNLNNAALASGGTIDLGNYDLSQGATTNTVTIERANLTRVTAAKTYDGLSTVAANEITSLAGVNGEEFTATAGTAAISDKNVRTSNKTLTDLSGLTIEGKNNTSTELISNYNLSTGLPLAGTNNAVTITAKTVTVSGSGVINKTYDGTTHAVLSGTASIGSAAAGSASDGKLVDGDNVMLDTTHLRGTYASKNVRGTDGQGANTVSLTGAALVAADANTDSDVSNYILVQQGDLTANNTIEKAVLTLGLSDQRKTYDGNDTAAIAAGNITAQGVTVGGQTEGATFKAVTGTFNSKNVAEAHTVTASVVANDVDSTSNGFDVSNYTLSNTNASQTVSNNNSGIDRANLVVTLAAQSKTYDGTTNASLASGAITATGVTVGGVAETATVSQGSGTYNSKNVTEANTVTATLAEGHFAGNNGMLLSNYNLPTTVTGMGTITPKTVTYSGLTVANKTYDRSTTASLSGTATLGTVAAGAGQSNDGKVIATDTVSLSGTAVGTYTSKNVTATNNIVTFSGLSLNGGDASNYSLVQQASVDGTGTIMAKTIAATAQASDKVYDGTTGATLVNGSLGSADVISGDTVTFSASGASFADRHVAKDGSGNVVGKTVTVSDIAIDGADAGNYALASDQATTTAKITPKTLTLAAVTDRKTYDGTTNSSAAVQVTGLESVDSITASQSFVSKNVLGEGNSTLQVNSGYTVNDGNNGNNYAVSTQTANGSIDRANLVVTLAAQSKTYDGGTNASLASGAITATGVTVGGVAETATVSRSSGTYASKNVLGTDGQGANTVTATLDSIDFTANTGMDLGNYNLPTSVTGTGTITAKTVALSASKTYDGTTTLTGNQLQITTGVGTETLSYSNASLNSKNVADNATNFVSAVTLADGSNGGLASNYAVSTARDVNNSASIDRATLSASLVGSVSKTYDATTSATLNSDHFSVTGWATGEGATVTQTVGAYASPNVDVNGGNGLVSASLMANHFTANSVTSLGNYVLPLSASGNIGTITPAPLTIKVNDTKAFVTQNANTAFNQGFSYSDGNGGVGWKGNDTAATALVREPLNADRTYTGATNPVVGTYTGVYGLGFTPTAQHGNYTITVAQGNLTVVPADKLLIHIAGQTDTYGNRNASNAGQASNVTAQYCLVASDCNGSNLYTLNLSAGTGNSWSGTDNTNTTISFNTTVDTTGKLSSGGWLRAGDHRWGVSGLTTSGTAPAPFNGSEVNSGTLTVNKLALTGVGIDAAGHTYGGTVAPGAVNFSDSNLKAGDQVGASASVVSTASDLSGSGHLKAGNYQQTASTLSSLNANNDADNYTFAGVTTGTANYTVERKALTASATANDKVYNGDEFTTVRGTSSTDIVGNDNVTIGATTAAFVDKNVARDGNGNVIAKAVTVSGLSLSGDDAGNYTLQNTSTTTTATITPKALTAAATANDKVYNGDEFTTVRGTSSTDIVGNDNVTIGATTAAFVDKNVARDGNGNVIAKAVTVSGLSLSGTDAGNYDLQNTSTTTTATITPKTVALSANKTYDGTTTLTGNQLQITTGVGTETLSYSNASLNSKNVADNATNFVNAITLADGSNGGLASNYTVSTARDTNNSASIDKANLVVTLAAQSKTYDGSTSASLASGAITATGVSVNGEAETATVSRSSGTYASKNVLGTDGQGANMVTASLASTDFSANTDTGMDLRNYNLPTTVTGMGTITPKTVTYSGLTVANKTYDRSTTASLSGTATLGTVAAGAGQSNDGKVIATDTVSLSGTAVGTYTSKNVTATNNIVTFSGLSLNGGDASNYSLVQQASVDGTGTIMAKTIAATAQASDKVYDGTTGATLVNGSLGSADVISGDTVTFSASGASFADRHVAKDGSGNVVGKTVTVSDIAIDGADAGNYALASDQATTTAKITPKTLTLAAVTDRKTYDGTTNSSAAVQVTGLESVDSITASQSFVSKNVLGEGNSTLQVNSGYTVNDGNNGNNYAVSTQTANGSIDRANLVVTLAAQSKTYDGGTNASLASGAITATGVTVGGVAETATVSRSSGTYASKNVLGTDGQGANTVTATLDSIDFTANTGMDLGNYNLPTSVTGTGTITAKTVALSASKTYDGTTTLTGNQLQITTGVGTETLSYSNASLNSKNVADNATNFVSAVTLADGSNGGLASNYAVSTARDVNNSASIDKANLVVALAEQSKTYDGSTSASLASGAITATGVTVGGVAETATVSRSSGTYNSKNVTEARTVTATLAEGDFAGNNGTLLSNYNLPTTVTGTGTITPKALTARLTGNVSKTYDGNTNATLGEANFAVDGFVDGESARVSQRAGTYASSNVSDNQGAGAVTADLLPTHLSANAGTLLSNYTLPSTASGNVGTITPAALTVRVGSTKAFVTQDARTAIDTGFAYEGLQGTDTASSALVQLPTANDRTYSGSTNTPAVGSYAEVYGLAATPVARNGNYTVTVRNGDLQVIEANKLLITVSGQDDIYGNRNAGNAGQASSVIAQYCLDASNCNGANLFNLGMSAGTGNAWSAVDNTNTTIRFNTTVDTTGKLSSGGWLRAGNHSWGVADLTTSGPAPFRGYEVNSGTLAISRLALTPTATAVSKTYDGTASAAGMSLGTPQAKTGDDVRAVSGGGQFSTRNVVSNDTVTYSNLQLQGTDQDNYALSDTTVQGTGSITPRAITLTGITAENKTYDGNTSAVVNTTGASFTNKVAGDDLSVSSTGTFDNKNAGENKTVNLTNTLGGTDLGNYSVTDQATTTARIDRRAITLSGITAENKTYDGNTSAVVNTAGASFTNKVAGDDLSVSSTGTFDNKNAGTDKTVNLTNTLSGADLGNYTVTDQASTTANIDRRAITLTGITAEDKTYDGNTSAVVNTAGASFTNMVAGDSLSVSSTGTFDNKNAGENKTVNLTNTLGGTDLGNYSVTDQATTTARITPKTLTARLTGSVSKTYDGNTSATLNAANFAVDGFVDGEGASVSQTVGTYASPNPADNTGTGRVSTSLAGSHFNAQAGTLLSNYTLPTAASGDVGTIKATATVTPQRPPEVPPLRPEGSSNSRVDVSPIFGGSGAAVGTSSPVAACLNPIDPRNRPGAEDTLTQPAGTGSARLDNLCECVQRDDGRVEVCHDAEHASVKRRPSGG